MCFCHFVFRMGFFQPLLGINLKKAKVSGSQTFFKIGVFRIAHKKTPVLESWKLKAFNL